MPHATHAQRARKKAWGPCAGLLPCETPRSVCTGANGILFDWFADEWFGSTAQLCPNGGMLRSLVDAQMHSFLRRYNIFFGGLGGGGGSGHNELSKLVHQKALGRYLRRMF